MPEKDREREFDMYYLQIGGHRLREWKEFKQGLEYYHIPTTRRRLLESLHLDKLSRELQAIIANGRKHPEYKIRFSILYNFYKPRSCTKLQEIYTKRNCLIKNGTYRLRLALAPRLRF